MQAAPRCGWRLGGPGRGRREGMEIQVSEDTLPCSGLDPGPRHRHRLSLGLGEEWGQYHHLFLSLNPDVSSRPAGPEYSKYLCRLLREESRISRDSPHTKSKQTKTKWNNQTKTKNRKFGSLYLPLQNAFAVKWGENSFILGSGNFLKLRPAAWTMLNSVYKYYTYPKLDSQADYKS